MLPVLSHRVILSEIREAPFSSQPSAPDRFGANPSCSRHMTGAFLDSATLHPRSNPVPAGTSELTFLHVPLSSTSQRLTSHVADIPSRIGSLGCAMKTPFLVVAVGLAVCSGCQSTNLMSGLFGHDKEDALSRFAESSEDANPSAAQLPPPTNAGPRSSSTLASTADEHLRLGEAALRDGETQQAQRHFEQALIAQPQHTKANHRLAVVCDKLGQYQRAEQHYRIALESDPRNVAVLSDLGYSYWLQGRYSESERYLLQARRIDPHYETAVANLGMLYGTTGRQEEALAMFRQIGDEAQVQEIMQQVAALAPRREVPANSAAGVIPAGLAENSASSGSMINASRESARDLSQVNGPTRELLELMEQGRRQQQLAEQAQQSQRSQERLTPNGRSIPPFAQNRPVARQPRPSPIAGVNPFQNTAPAVRPAGPRQVPDHMLSQAIADIDRQGRRPPTGPITIGPPVQPPQALSSNRYRQSPPTANGTQTPWPSSSQQQFRASNGSARPQSSPIDAVPRERSGPPVTAQTSEQTAPQTAAWDQFTPQASPNPSIPSREFASAAPHSREQTMYATDGADHSQHLPNASQASDIWGQVPNQELADHSQHAPGHHADVQQASVSTPPPADDWAGQPAPFAHHPSAQQPVAQPPVDHAHHQHHPGAATAIDLARDSTTGRGETLPPATGSAPPVPGQNWPLIPSSKTDPGDPYEQARRQAAIMGLGAGPGQMFPYVQQTPRSAPGTDSRWNGAQYPSPQRNLPSGMTPADLSPAFSNPQAADLTPAQSYQGQQLPQVAAPMNRPLRYGAASSGHFQQHQLEADAVPSSGNMLQPYEDARQQQSRQLTGLINETYGQPRQSPAQNISAPKSHASGTPANPQSNNSIWTLLPSQPAEQSRAEPMPSQGNARPRSDTAATFQESAPTARATSTIVIPEPYHRTGTTSRQFSQQPSPGGTENRTVEGAPMIVPRPR